MGLHTVTSSSMKPHVLLVPLPGASHLFAMWKLGALIHAQGSHVTFVLCEHYPGQLPAPEEHPEGFVVRRLSEWYPLDSSLPRVASTCSAAQERCGPHIRNLIAEINGDAASLGTPPISLVIADGTLTCAVEVAQELGITAAVYWPMSVSALVCFLQYPEMVRRGLLPVRDAKDLEAPVDWIQGMKAMKVKDMPSYCRMKDEDDATMFHFLSLEAKRSSKAPAILFNTFEDLERDALHALSSTIPRVYTVGPVPLLLSSKVPNNPIPSSWQGKWEADPSCLEWLGLGSRPPASVVYVNFGSLASLTKAQTLDFAWGLANSNHSFLWVMREDLVMDCDSVSELLAEFFEVIKGRGLIHNGWCPQEDVLSHPSVGAFVTHNGWNSTLESLYNGVPMICWPCFCDQQTNSHCVRDEWGVGLQLPEDLKMGDVERLVRKVMGDEGKEMRERALVWKRTAAAAVEEAGGSWKNFDRFVADMVFGNGTKGTIPEEDTAR